MDSVTVGKCEVQLFHQEYLKNLGVKLNLKPGMDLGSRAHWGQRTTPEDLSFDGPCFSVDVMKFKFQPIDNSSSPQLCCQLLPGTLFKLHEKTQDCILHWGKMQVMCSRLSFNLMYRPSIDRRTDSCP